MGQRERVLSLEHEGRVYNLRPRDFSALDDLEVHRETGTTIAQIMFGGRVTLFTMAALVWRARVNSGEESLPYRDVAKSFTFDDIATVEPEERDDDAPLVPAAS